MGDYKKDFIEFALAASAFKAHGDFSLKSKRLSPWFFNVGDFDDGEAGSKLGGFYADALLNSGHDFDILYGIPEKGYFLAGDTASTMARKGKNVPRFSTRKEAKDYGESTGLSQEDKMKAWVVGRKPKNGQSIAQLDDVFTAGDAKYEARRVLQNLGDFMLPVLAIAVDRQEVATDGRSAIEEYEERTGTKVVSIVNASDVYTFLKERAPLQTPNGEITLEDVTRLQNYLRCYGTPTVRKVVGQLEKSVIERERSVIPACDVETLEQFEKLVKETANVEGIGGYKIGFELGLAYGLPRVVEAARKHTKKPVIYDHQKAGTDIPDTGKSFARVCKNAGVDAVILFPQSGPETERAWIYHALNEGLGIIVGGRMTHPAYSQSEGGFITDEGALEMYKIAARAGVKNFVVPGNKTEVIKQVREVVESEGVEGVFYAPGFIAQGGKIGDAAMVAGNRFHGIVGRGIYQSSDMRQAAIEHTSQI